MTMDEAKGLAAAHLKLIAAGDALLERYKAPIEAAFGKKGQHAYTLGYSANNACFYVKCIGADSAMLRYAGEGEMDRFALPLSYLYDDSWELKHVEEIEKARARGAGEIQKRNIARLAEYKAQISKLEAQIAAGGNPPEEVR